MNLFRTKNLNDILSDSEKPEYQLKKSLTAIDLTALGIGAIIGAGIFAVLGSATAGGNGIPPAGPGCICFDIVDCGCLRILRSLLRGVCKPRSDCRVCIHIQLRHARRTRGMDHRLGFDSRICGRKYRCRNFMGGILSTIGGGIWNPDPCMDGNGLSFHFIRREGGR